MATEYFTRLTVELLTEGLAKCPRVNLLQDLPDCGCEKMPDGMGQRACQSLIRTIADQMEAEARHY